MTTIVTRYNLEDKYSNDMSENFLKDLLTKTLPNEVFVDWLIQYNNESTKVLTKIIKNHIKEKRYMYMITFTLKDPKDETQAEEYIISQAKREALQIVQYQYAKEYTKKGIAHWHVAIETKIPIKKDRFIQYYKNKSYGNIDLSRSKSTNYQNILNYISKDTNPIVLK